MSLAFPTAVYLSELIKMINPFTANWSKPLFLLPVDPNKGLNDLLLGSTLPSLACLALLLQYCFYFTIPRTVFVLKTLQ